MIVILRGLRHLMKLTLKSLVLVLSMISNLLVWLTDLMTFRVYNLECLSVHYWWSWWRLILILRIHAKAFVLIENEFWTFMILFRLWWHFLLFNWCSWKYLAIFPTSSCTLPILVLLRIEIIFWRYLIRRGIVGESNH